MKRLLDSVLLKVQICARPNAMDQMELANNVSAPIQTFFEEYHNVSYPLEKTSEYNKIAIIWIKLA